MSDATRPAAPPAIQFENVTLHRGGTLILDGVSGRIGGGETVALLGANGSGKTTLSRVMLGQMWPSEGVVHVLGERLGRTELRKLRRRIGVVNGATDLGPGELRRTGAIVDARLDAVSAVCTGFFATVSQFEKPTEEQRDAAAELLRIVGLGHRLSHPLLKLSTGEQRRAVLARALVTKPELVILDEPTAGLDLPGREQLLAALADLRAARPRPTILLITHHVEEIPGDAERVWLMQAGRLTHDGPPAEVLQNDALSAAFGCDVRVSHDHGRYWVQVAANPWAGARAAVGT
ncbi:ABC transporter ATP-binding protein [Alienimonas californiensis]|uniref:Putative ABC transporter ATP-binding protein YlmA n=1 Tax=Alienimonas californiensis TaxID=2527989 RepID=A0A517P4W1_9PLAN|nr:ATP-binding cassette domain-containing protein [Alienimonas californiensis]QDT14413.1 putative ABC transporter ATP-binding protein YlmA [Alienimonas californiensis]